MVSRPLVDAVPKVSGQAPERRGAAVGSLLLPVRVVASAAKPRRVASTGASGQGLLESALPSGLRVRFSAGKSSRHDTGTPRTPVGD